MGTRFTEIVSLIRSAQVSAYRSVNKELINLYWNVGYYIAQKVNAAQWGDKTVDELANFIQTKHPDLRGFNRRGLYRMRQFYETYKDDLIVSSTRPQLQSTDNKENKIVSSTRTQFRVWDIRQSALTELGWTHHRTIFSRCQTVEENIFYIKLSLKENYTVKELDRQIIAAVYERTMLSKTTKIAESISNTKAIQPYFKDLYVFEFLNLPEAFTENEENEFR